MRLGNVKLLGGVLALVAMGCGPLAAQSAAQEDKNLKMVMAWWKDVVVTGHADQASKYMADSFVDHDPNVMGGRAEFLAHYAKMAKGSLPATPAESFAKGDYVALVFEHPDRDPKTSTPYSFFTYDIFKVKDGKIQEHWDTLRKMP